MQRELMLALAAVKRACALANRASELLGGAVWCGSGRIAPSPANGWLRQ